MKFMSTSPHHDLTTQAFVSYLLSQTGARGNVQSLGLPSRQVTS